MFPCDNPKEAALGSGSKGSLASEVARCAWQALGARLLARLETASSAAGSWETWAQPWSGALLVSLPWCGSRLMLLVAPEAVEAFACQQGLLPASRTKDGTAPLASLKDALQRLPTAFRVELAPLEVEMGAILSLREGDVLCTSHALDRPLLVRSVHQAAGAAQPLCGAFLGKRKGHRAIELARPS